MTAQGGMWTSVSNARNVPPADDGADGSQIIRSNPANLISITSVNERRGAPDHPALDVPGAGMDLQLPHTQSRREEGRFRSRQTAKKGVLTDIVAASPKELPQHRHERRSEVYGDHPLCAEALKQIGDVSGRQAS